MRKIIFTILIIIGCALQAQAQNEYERLRSIYDRAEENYNIGRLDEAEKELTDNLKDFPDNLRQSAYRLLALCNLGNDKEEVAEEITRLLLAENPYFSTNANDPQRFIDMVERIKEGRSATITTASSQAETLNEVPVPTTLITAEMIKNCGGRNLQEVLAAFVPGMTIVDCNDDINIAMRGIYSNGQEKILIMLNGHRLNSYATNIAAPDFSISLEKVKQIEVLRGPASSLYGGVSLTAVVNVITWQGADIDGIEVHAGAGSYGQLKASMMLGKRYFDLDLLIWGGLYKAKGQKIYVPDEETGLKREGGDALVGGIGPKPSYDVGAQLKYKNLSFLYNAQFSQIISPMTLNLLFTPYDYDKYRSFNSIKPSFATLSHHGELNYGQQLGNVYLKGTVTYDNSDLTHYQVISDNPAASIIPSLPIPSALKETLYNSDGGLSRYINGQEHTIGGKIQGDWSYINSKHHKGILSFGAEYSYFQLDDVQYMFGYNFDKQATSNDSIPELGKGHESNINSYVQLKHHWGPLILNAGLRFDYKNRYNDTKIREFSPRVALIFVQPKWNVKLSYSKSFIDAPYMYRKINLFLATFAGYKDLATELDPEALHSYQLTFGANQWLPGLDFEINGFYNRARNIIYMNIIEHENSGSSDIYGVELSAKYKYSNFTANLSAAWQDVKKSSINNTEFNFAFCTPKLSVSTVLAWQATKWLNVHGHIDYYSSQKSWTTDAIGYALYNSAVNHYGEMYKQWMINPTPENEKLMNQAEMAMYEAYQKVNVTHDFSPRVLFDLGATCKFGKLTISADVKNLFNKSYKQSGLNTGPIPQKGRWFMFDIGYKF